MNYIKYRSKYSQAKVNLNKTKRPQLCKAVLHAHGGNANKLMFSRYEVQHVHNVGLALT